MADYVAADGKDHGNDRNDWDKQLTASFIVESRKKRMIGLAFGVLTVVALFVVVIVKGTSPATNTGAPPNLSSTPHKPVPELKPESSAPVAVPAAVPDIPLPQSAYPYQLQQDQSETQRAEKARLLLDARIKSAIDPDVGSSHATSPGMPASQLSSGQLALGAGLPGAGPQDANSRFARSVSGNGVPSSKASNITQLDYKILQGKVIEAVTIPRAISDLPGTICAMVQRDVYAERGRVKLIPWGSRLCGVYSAELRKGQDRLFAIWNTLRVSNADGSISEVALDSTGSDQLGSAGMGGTVDTHFAEIFGTSALLSIIGAGAANAGVSSGDQNNSSAQYRESVQQAAAQTSQSVLAPYANIPPTVTVPAGSRVRIFVNRDLDFSTIYQARVAVETKVNADPFE